MITCSKLVCPMQRLSGLGSPFTLAAPTHRISRLVHCSVAVPFVSIKEEAPLTTEEQKRTDQHSSPAAGMCDLTRTKYKIVSEREVYKRYLTLYDREVQFTSVDSGEVQRLHFDVVGHPQCAFRFAVVFPFHPYKDGRPGGEVTVIREYGQGVNALMYCLPTGGFDPVRHASLEECARAELSEEAHLCGGQLVRLLAEDHMGLSEVKWCMNRFIPYLVIAPQQDLDPGSRDAEEMVMSSSRLDLVEFKKLLKSGDMSLPSITTSYFALDYLQEEGYL